MAEENTKAPSQFKQPSRKGKKAWRKNVDVTQIDEGLENVREELIKGGVIAEKLADELFAVDTTGSTEIQKSYKKHKQLKADEILAQRSAIPAVSSRKRSSDVDAESKNKRRKAGVSHKEYDRLRSIAYGGDSASKDVVKVEGASFDPWAAEVAVRDPRFSFLEKKKSKVEPETLKKAALSLTKSGKPIPAIRKPEAGKSYNPTFEDWDALVTREGDKEIAAERRRLKAANEEQERMEKALATAAEPDPESDEENDWESEWEGIQSEAEDSSLKLKRPQRKTQAERNKIQRRKEAIALAKHEKKMLDKERQVAKVKALAEDATKKEAARREALAVQGPDEDVESEDDEGELRRKRFGKARIPQAPLEVVLADELQDSLRRLKPEGNLVKDRFRNMMINGKIETRSRISMHKKRRLAYTEKWSYKDWKLK